MKQQANVKERYIQLVETFISAIESGRSGAELQEIRNEIRRLSGQLNQSPHVENHTQPFDFLTNRQHVPERNNDTDKTIS